MTDTLHICAACGFEYEQRADNQADFHELSDDWQCPECGIAKFMFHHYACVDVVSEMTGMIVSLHPFNTVQLKNFDV